MWRYRINIKAIHCYLLAMVLLLSGISLVNAYETQNMSMPADCVMSAHGACDMDMSLTADCSIQCIISAHGCASVYMQALSTALILPQLVHSTVTVLYSERVIERNRIPDTPPPKLA